MYGIHMGNVWDPYAYQERMGSIWGMYEICMGNIWDPAYCPHGQLNPFALPIHAPHGIPIWDTCGCVVWGVVCVCGQVLQDRVETLVIGQPRADVTRMVPMWAIRGNHERSHMFL